MRKPRRKTHLCWSWEFTSLCGLAIPDRGIVGSRAVCKNCERIAEKNGWEWSPLTFTIGNSSTLGFATKANAFMNNATTGTTNVNYTISMKTSGSHSVSTAFGLLAA